jgi:hypothetical protein
MNTQFEDYEVIYDWEAENEDDVSLYAGEVILVKEKHDHGWWYGVIERDGVLHKGHFPKNYVKARANVPPPRPPPPQRPLSTKEASNGDPSNLSNRLGRMLINDPIREGQSFSLRSLTAFDELSEYGVTLEIENFGGNKAASGDVSTINPGMRVEIECVGMIWDGSAVITREFSKGILCFTVGKSQVTEGLDLAVQRMKIGESAWITCAPSKAYGAAGNPPYISPDTYIVYHVKVSKSFMDSAQRPTDAVGPDAMLGSGVNNRAIKNAAAGKQVDKGGRVVFSGTKVDALKA